MLVAHVAVRRMGTPRTSICRSIRRRRTTVKGMSARIRCQMDASSPPPLPHSPNAVIMEWDLVLFPDDAAEAQAGPRGLWNVGKVEEVREHKGECTCQPLYQEAGTGVWLESHERGPTTVRLSEVRAMDTSTYDFAQRMAPDRVSNPHGEHAEDVWEITVDLPDEVRRAE